jgi:hypothetical protein
MLPEGSARPDQSRSAVEIRHPEQRERCIQLRELEGAIAVPRSRLILVLRIGPSAQFPYHARLPVEGMARTVNVLKSCAFYPDNHWLCFGWD